MRSATSFKLSLENLQFHRPLCTATSVVISLASALLYPLLPPSSLAGGHSESEIRTRLERVARAPLLQLSSEPGKPMVQTDAAARLRLEQMVTQAAAQLAAQNADENEIRRAEINLSNLLQTAGSLAEHKPTGGGIPSEPGRGGGGPGAPSTSQAIIGIQTLRMAMGQLCPIYPFC